MADYDNNRTGVLFKNVKKHEEGGNEKWPDYKGSCEIDGVEFWLAAWIKTKKADGSKFMSITFEPKEKQAAEKPAPAAKKPAGAFDDMKDDTPW